MTPVKKGTEGISNTACLSLSSSRLFFSRRRLCCHAAFPVSPHRRFHEWVPSTCNQHYKKFRAYNINGSGAILNSNGQIYWPGINGGYKIPSLPNFVKSRWIDNKKGRNSGSASSGGGSDSDSVNFYKKS